MVGLRPAPALGQDNNLTQEERAKEAEAQRAIGTHSSNSDLIQLLHNSPNKYVRGISAKWLGERHAVEARGPVFRAMNDSEIYVQRRAAVAYARLSDCFVPDQLLGLLQAPRATTRLVAIGALIELLNTERCSGVEDQGVKRILPPMRRLIRDPSPDVRREAIVLLDRLGQTVDQEQKADLLLAAVDDQDANVRIAAVRALQGTQDQRVVDRLVDLLEDPVPLVMREAVKALAASGSAEAMSAVSDLLTHRDPEFRVSAIRALVELEAPRAASDLALMLDDRSSLVRFEAVKGLAALRPPNVSHLLIPKLDDFDAQVRLVTARAFYDLCPKDDVQAARALAKTASDSNPRVALQAVAALHCIRSDENIPELIEALCSASNKDVRAALTRLLENSTHSRPGGSCTAWRTWLQDEGQAWQHRRDREGTAAGAEQGRETIVIRGP